jgi:hypothetical protein
MTMPVDHVAQRSNRSARMGWRRSNRVIVQKLGDLLNDSKSNALGLVFICVFGPLGLHD